MNAKAVVLLSAGLDSTVNFHRALKDYDVVAALTFDYGQRAAKKEISCARAQCEKFGVSHHVVGLPWLGAITNTSLVNTDADVPVGDEVSIDDTHASMGSAERVWVPNRNGLFLNVAASFAESLGASYVIPGFNKEEAVTFPDNSADFLKATDQSFSFSTANQVKTKCFTIDMDKTEIAALGKELGVNFNIVWPCYLDGDQLCGECESCQRYNRAMEGSGAG